MSPSSGVFPVTRQSLVAHVRSDDPELRSRAFGAIVAAYWKPVYKYLRIRWRAEHDDACDLTQGFFADALEREAFARFDPARARFRTYLRVCLDGYVSNERKAARRQKRGGGVEHVPLDFAAAEGELRAQGESPELDPDAYFHREWVRSLFSAAVDALRRQCDAAGKQVHFALFERYDLDDARAGAADAPSYASLAESFALPVTQVTNHLAFARREFRRHVLELLRASSGSDEEYREEARALLGIDAP